MVNPKISIITVVYNSSKYLERTIISVINQTYKNIEFVIIDGGSTDGTIEIIKKFESSISYWISESDKGIYDAMNKGINAATGDYLWFMNSGDLIFDNDTLYNLIKISDNADIYFGETVIIDSENNILRKRRHPAPKNLTWRSFKYGMMVAHQSIIVKKSLAPLYDLNYKVSADIDWVMKCLKISKIIVNTELILSRYLLDGFSQKHLKTSLAERFAIMKKNYGLIPTLYFHIIIMFRLIGYKLFKKK